MVSDFRLASPQTSFGVRLSGIHFSPTDDANFRHVLNCLIFLRITFRELCTWVVWGKPSVVSFCLRDLNSTWSRLGKRQPAGDSGQLGLVRFRFLNTVLKRIWYVQSLIGNPSVGCSFGQNKNPLRHWQRYPLHTLSLISHEYRLMTLIQTTFHAF